jgi:hypothetical protein
MLIFFSSSFYPLQGVKANIAGGKMNWKKKFNIARGESQIFFYRSKAKHVYIAGG